MEDTAGVVRLGMPCKFNLYVARLMQIRKHRHYEPYVCLFWLVMYMLTLVYITYSSITPLPFLYSNLPIPLKRSLIVLLNMSE